MAGALSMAGVLGMGPAEISGVGTLGEIALGSLGFGL
jgi:hypothetical protein